MLKGKRIVVLGGTAGIGLGVAERLVEEGARVVVASSNQARVDEARKRLGGAEGFAVNLRSPEAITALFAEVGAFDHLIYTAGEELLFSSLDQLDFEKARAFFDVRYWGALAAVKAARPHLSREGSIVLTGGTAGTRPFAGFVLGASICGAMESVTRVLAVELAPIRVNIVVPGLVDTGLWANMPEAGRAQLFDETAAKLPVGRVGTPADIAEHYLAFLKSRYTTGQSIIVDGGGVLV